MGSKGPTSFFNMCIPNCLSISCWKVYLFFPVRWYCHPGKKNQLVTDAWAYLWNFNSISLIYMSILLPELACLVTVNFALSFKKGSGMSELSKFFFFKIVSVILGLLSFQINFQINLSISAKNPAEILLQILLNL